MYTCHLRERIIITINLENGSLQLNCVGNNKSGIRENEEGYYFLVEIDLRQTALILCWSAGQLSCEIFV